MNQVDSIVQYNGLGQLTVHMQAQSTSVHNIILIFDSQATHPARYQQCDLKNN